MNTKLTLTLHKEVIEKAKKYAAEKGSSLSELVENYFRLLTEAENKEKEKNFNSSKLNKIRGVLKIDDDVDYKKAIEEEINKKHHG